MVALRTFITHITSVLHAYARDAGSAGGLLIGDELVNIERVLLAAELNADVADEALRARVDLIITLRTPETLPLAGEEGAHVRNLVAGGVSVYSVADHTSGLVAQALMNVFGLDAAVPLIPADLHGYALAVVYVPEEHAQDVRIALASAGAGAIGDYTGCAWSVTGTGEFTPGPRAEPVIGTVGLHEQVRERRLEMVVPLDLIPAVTAALRSAHPYEEPAFSFVMTHPAPSRRGRGRRGVLAEPMTLAEVRELLAQQLPEGAIRLSGVDGPVREIAVISRAGERGVEAAIDAGVDLLVSSDLRYGELTRAREAGLHLIDVPQAALLWFALPLLARRLEAGMNGEIEAIVTTTAQPTWRDG